MASFLVPVFVISSFRVASFRYFVFSSFRVASFRNFVFFLCVFVFSLFPRGMFACILKTVARLSYECSYDIRTTIVHVPRNFRIVNSQNFAATCSQVCVGYG